jgi:hypothetical protein
MKLAASLSLMLVFFAVAGASARDEKLTQYVVQPGDTCWSIALKVFGNGEKYTLIHRYNELGPMPHVLEPGTVLKLPIAGESALAKVDWLQQEVEARPPSAFDWRAAEENMPLWRLYRVRTGEASAAGVEFEDQSRLRMRAQTLLVVYGTNAEKSRLERQVRTWVTLEKGGIRGGLARLDQEASMEVRTASSQVKLKSRDSQIDVDEAETTAISVYDGKARVSAKGDAVTVADGEGTTVDKGKPPAPPRPLPQAPQWEGEEKDLVVIVPQTALGEFELAWQPVKTAVRYRVELALDEAFRRVLTDAEIGAGIQKFAARALEPGTYYVRVSAIDDRKLQSRASSTVRVRIAEVLSSRALNPDDTGEITVVGLLQLTLPAPLAVGVEAALDDGPFQPADQALRLMEPRVYKVRFRATGSTRESALTIRLLKTNTSLEIPPAPHTKSVPLPIRLLLRDERGRPAALPGLTLASSPGGVLPLVQESAGQYTATLPAGSGTVAIEAFWTGGRLARTEVVFEDAVKPVDKGPEFLWQNEPIALAWSGPADSISSRGATPISRLGVYINTAMAPENTAGVPQYFRTALAGQIELFDERLGMDAELAFFDIALQEDLPDESVLDALRLGIRARVLHTRRTTLSPSFRASLPTSNRTDLTNRFTLEPALLLDWAVLRHLYLGTNQVFVIRTGDGDTDLEYAATLDGEVRIENLVGLAIELGLLVRGKNVDPDDNDIEGLSLDGGWALRFYLKRFRIGLQAGGGLNQAARHRIGAYTVGVNLDLGLGKR